jgi:pimeloyl-ACP methyl ester carboxylesterase
MLVLTVVTLLVIALTLLVCFIAFRKVFASQRKKHVSLYHGLGGEPSDMKSKRLKLLERMLKIPYEELSITSFDGTRLYAGYYHKGDGLPLAIQFHGYRSMRIRDFSGVAYEALELRQNVLLVDQRAHGKSEGGVISFGIKERFDCKAWIEYATERFGKDVKIILYGISMGAATVLMASELDLPENVVGIVADCPYSSPKAIIKKVCRDIGLSPLLTYPFIKIGALLFGGFNPDEASPVEAVKNTNIPILLIHGEGDRFVPTSMSDEIAGAGKCVTYLKIAEATHALSMLYDRTTYISALKKFTENILEKSEVNKESENQ